MGRGGALRMGRRGDSFLESSGYIVGSGLVRSRQTASRGGGRAVIGLARGERHGKGFPFGWVRERNLAPAVEDRAGADRGRRLNGAQRMGRAGELRMGRGGDFFLDSAGDIVGSGLVRRRQTASRGGGRAVIGSARKKREGG
ncbi:hypothetical protein B7486_05425 [cyanobacterium TDX16]|nr:hypothetical protein B7486_05425 [cyanobacterium TDX16]